MWLHRLIAAMAGACFGAGLVALLEARVAQAAETGSHAPAFGALLAADVAVLAPIAIGVGAALAATAIFLEPGRPQTFGEHFARLRREPVLTRSRTAAMAPLAILAAFGWTLTIAHLGRHTLAHGAPAASGVELATTSAVALFVLAGAALALMPPLRRALAAGAASRPRLVDPITTGAIGLGVAALALGVGILLGDNGGNGPTPLAIFGVLKRNELDLRPIINLVLIAISAWLAQLAFAQRPRMAQGAVAAFVVIGAVVIHVREASALDETPAVARAIERHAPLGKIALAVVRKLSDRDHDGYSARFGGGDCNDRDKLINPAAIDIPGNGVDEDCSGADTPKPLPPVPAPIPPPDAAAAPKIDKDFNLVLITIDTLRCNVGFMGYPKPTSPNLDKLAAKSTIFDRAYAMASYTGKSLAPLLIGKYPSETLRDGGHFNRYAPDNVFITERLKSAGVRTFGAASHWYFRPSFGLTQGMDEWDTSPIPGDGQGESDTSITSPQVTDAAIKLLGKQENTAARFFMWVHYFDPHAEFMPHQGAPPELKPDDQKAPGWGLRWMYDGEIWFTDKHVGRLLDFIESQPWGPNTIIAVTADHGEAIVEHNMTYHGFELWEQLVHVPLVVFVPGAVPHHVTANRGHVDVVPTLLDLMRQTVPGRPDLSGDSMIADVFATAGPTGAMAFAERDVYVDMPPGPNNGMRHALFHGPAPGLKLIHIQGNQYQLFDLAKDPGEADDIASDKSRLGPMVEAFQVKKASLKEIWVKPDEPPH